MDDQWEGTLRIVRYVDPRTPDEFKRLELDDCRKKMAFNLFNALERTRLPAVVDIKQEIRQSPFRESYPFINDEIEIQATITPVQYHHVTITKLDYIRPPKINFWKRLKWLLKGSSIDECI